MWSRIISGIVVALVVAAAAWAFWPRPVAVEVATIDQRPLLVTIEEEGISQIREVFQVSAPIAGNLTRVTVHSGDRVTEGQAVAAIRPVGPGLLDDRSRSIAVATVAAATSAVEVAKTSLAQAEAQQAFAAVELERILKLSARGLVSTRIEQQKTLEASTAESNVAAAKATLLMRQQELERAEAALIEGDSATDADRCCVDVRAPVTGQVLAVKTESAQVVQPGTPLLEIGDPADLEVLVDVLSSDAVRISEGAPASIEGWGGEALSARVTRVEPVATMRMSALGVEEQRARVTLAFTDAEQDRQRLGHGYRVVAKIVVWEAPNVVAVPMGALFRQGERWAVFVEEADKAVVRFVTLGERNADYAEVLDGLVVGETVIVHPADTITDGVAVTATQS